MKRQGLDHWEKGYDDEVPVPKEKTMPFSLAIPIKEFLKIILYFLLIVFVARLITW